MKITANISGIFAISVALALPLAAGASALDQPQSCLDWKIETHAVDSEYSGCAYFNRDKISTRFMARNHCDASVKGVFSYYKSDFGNGVVMNVQAFTVKPGAVEEVANPCNLAEDFGYQVSKISF